MKSTALSRAKKPSPRRLVPVRLRYEFTATPPAKVWDKVMRIVGWHQQSPLHQVRFDTCQRWNGEEVAYFDCDGNGYADDIRYCVLREQVTVTSITIERSDGLSFVPQDAGNAGAQAPGRLA